MTERQRDGRTVEHQGVISITVIGELMSRDNRASGSGVKGRGLSTDPWGTPVNRVLNRPFNGTECGF